MYKFAIVLSTIPSHNLFRQVVQQSFRSGYLTDFLICSGFFHERSNKRGSFFASDAFTGATVPNSSSVTVVGAYEPASKEFDVFCSKLASGVKRKNGSSLPLVQRRAVKKYANKWHSKLYLAKQYRKYRLAVIGSSNLTRSAFSPASSNNESDVIIWDDSHVKTKRLIDEVLLEGRSSAAQGSAGQTILLGNYDPADPRNSHQGQMQNRLDKIWKDVLFATV